MQVLGRRIGREVAALDENDAAADAGETSGQRDAGGAGTDDAQIGSELLVRRQAARVDEYRRVRPSTTSRRR